LFVDEKPLPKISYYRLKQIDLDKSFVYSKIEEVNFEDEVISIYPNPTTGYLKISNCKNYNKIIVLDILGRQVYSAELNKETLNVDLSALQNGEYFLTLINLADQSKYTSKIIIEKGSK